MHEEDEGGPLSPADIAEYIADVADQLARLAQRAAFDHTAAALLRAKQSALADLGGLQLGKAAPDDAA